MAIACTLVSTRAEAEEFLGGTEVVGIFKNCVMGESGFTLPEGVRALKDLRLADRVTSVRGRPGGIWLMAAGSRDDTVGVMAAGGGEGVMAGGDDTVGVMAAGGGDDTVGVMAAGGGEGVMAGGDDTVGVMAAGGGEGVMAGGDDTVGVTAAGGGDDTVGVMAAGGGEGVMAGGDDTVGVIAAGGDIVGVHGVYSGVVGTPSAVKPSKGPYVTALARGCAKASPFLSVNLGHLSMNLSHQPFPLKSSMGPPHLFSRVLRTMPITLSRVLGYPMLAQIIKYSYSSFSSAGVKYGFRPDLLP